MSTTAHRTGAGTPASDRRRWWALAWISVSQLMVVIDATVMNIALPSIQRDLGLTDGERQWVIAAYALTFGALLLLGGRLSDSMGRKRGLLIGLAGFTVASAVGGVAVSPEMLICARVAQGVYGALLTPSALALLSDTFPGGPQRTKAFGVFGTIMGSGSGIGVVLGGVLTGTLGWRWALLINIPIALVAGAGIVVAVTATAAMRRRLDILGALLSCAGLALVVLGMTNVERNGWGDPATIGLLAAGAVVIAVFVVSQHRVSEPVMPPRLLADRQRSSAFLAMFFWGVAILPAFLFLSVYLQQVSGFSTIQAGLAFLPYTVAILVTVRIVRPLLKHAAPRALLTFGLLLIAAGLLVLALLKTDSDYWIHVLPVFLLLGVGTGCVQPAANSAATFQAGGDSAVASAIASTSQQVGGSFGLTLLGAIAAIASTVQDGDTAQHLAATVRGYHQASLTGAALVAVAAIAVFVLSGHAAPDDSQPMKKGTARSS
ncbi:MFS transporter [Microbacterium lushaniae]|nr:MFS transporter [Microbacterium lushaniae]KAA9156079.1 MFS transporter [Microbacterium lushaniae]